MASATGVGALLAGRRPRHPVGWLLLAIGGSVIALGVADAYAAYGALARPGSLPGGRWAAIYVDSSWILLSTLLGFVLLLTPTGSPPSPRWRWWARLVVAAILVVLLSLLVAAGSLVVRFRRARGTERQQLRWVSAAAAAAGLAVAFTLVTWAMLGPAAIALWGWAEGVYITLLPLAIAASILRYRLYDLDQIVSRTLAWSR